MRRGEADDDLVVVCHGHWGRSHKGRHHFGDDRHAAISRQFPEVHKADGAWLQVNVDCASLLLAGWDGSDMSVDSLVHFTSGS